MKGFLLLLAFGAAELFAMARLSDHLPSLLERWENARREKRIRKQKEKARARQKNRQIRIFPDGKTETMAE